MPYFNLKFLHIMKWWCYSAGDSKETRYTAGQRSTLFSHSVLLISVSAQYLEKERMEFDQNLHMHWYLHNLSWDCSIHVIISWWPRGRFDSHFREIGFSIRVVLMACLKPRSLQFRGCQNDRQPVTYSCFLNSSSCCLWNFLPVLHMPLFGPLTQGEIKWIISS